MKKVIKTKNTKRSKTIEELEYDNEPLTEEELRALEESRKDMEAGNVYTLEEIIREIESEKEDKEILYECLREKYGL